RPVADRGRRHGADQQIAGNPPAVGHRERQHHDAEQVEPLADCGGGTAEREDKRAGEVEGKQQVTDPDLIDLEDGCHRTIQARAAAVIAVTPVSKVGWMTGAKCGLWLVGMVASLPAACASAYSLGSVPPTNQNTDGTPHSAPNEPKSSLAEAGPVSWTRSGEKYPRKASTTRLLAAASLTASG